MTFRSFVRPLVVALSLAFAATAAAPAFAETGSDRSSEHVKEKGKDKADHKGKRGKGKGKRAKLQFPLDAEKFSKHVDARIAKAKERLSGALDKHSVGDAQKTKILKDFDDSAALVRAAVKRAAKDGTITKEEAKDVRALVKNLRKQLKDRLPKKSEKAVAKDV